MSFDPMPAPTVRCPFYPTCEAVMVPLAQRRTIGTDDVEYTYPPHRVEGENSWFGFCPASHFLIVFDSTMTRFNLTEEARAVLAVTSEHFTRAVIARVKRVREAREEQRPKNITDFLAAVFAPDEDVDQNVGGAPDRPREEYFPGRPADAPEPGPEDPPDAPPPPWAGGGPIGKAPIVADNARDNLKQLTGLAITQMGQTQDVLSRVTALLDQAAALVVAAEHQVRSAGALVTTAVGSGGNNEFGNAMAEHTALAVSTIGDQADGILPAVQIAKSRVSTAHRQLAVAVENAKRYQNVPG